MSSAIGQSRAYRDGKRGLVLYLPLDVHRRLKIESALADEPMDAIGIRGVVKELERRERRRGEEQVA